MRNKSMYLSFVLLYISLAVINAVYYCEPTFAPRSRNSANTSRTSRSTDFNSNKNALLFGLQFVLEIFCFRLRNAAVLAAKNISERRK